jgi:hypothetical protein
VKRLVIDELPDECRNRLGEHKVPYLTWEEAETACYQMWNVSAKPTLFAYPAPCGSYHIGHAQLAPPPR